MHPYLILTGQGLPVEAQHALPRRQRSVSRAIRVVDERSAVIDNNRLVVDALELETNAFILAHRSNPSRNWIYPGFFSLCMTALVGCIQLSPPINSNANIYCCRANRSQARLRHSDAWYQPIQHSVAGPGDASNTPKHWSDVWGSWVHFTTTFTCPRTTFKPGRTFCRLKCCNATGYVGGVGMNTRITRRHLANTLIAAMSPMTHVHSGSVVWNLISTLLS